MASELFRPRLPLNPFAAIDHNIPWSIPQNLPLSHPQIILVIGDPPIDDLIPLLTSIHLSHSLVIIATDNPPLIPDNTRGPALRILRLSQPLAAHDAGALRLLSLFERAQCIAHLWPRHSSPHVIQLAQPSPNSDFSIIEPVSYATKKSGTNEFGRYPLPASDSVSSSKWRSTLFPQSTSHKKIRHTNSALKNLDDKMNYKPFDAIINFLPQSLPDKIILKHAILVTTLSAQFLAASTCISTTPHFSKADSKTHYPHSPTTLIPIQTQTQKSVPFSSVSSLSDSYSSTSQCTSSPSGSTPATSPCPSPPPRRLSKDLLAATAPNSSVKKRFSLLFRVPPPPPPPRPEFRPPPEASDVNISMERSRKVTNAHLVHVLPADWSPDYVPESDRNAIHPSSSSPGRSRQPHSAGYFKTPNGTGGIGKPKLVQSIEQFLLSFAYPLGSVVSANSSSSLHSGTGLSASASYLKKRPKSARLVSSTSTISEEPIITACPRPRSSPGLKSNTKAYEQENPLVCVSTLPIPPSTSNLTISSNTNTPVKPAPYLLAPSVFGRCVLRSGGSNARFGCSSPSPGCSVNEDDLEQNHEDTPSDMNAYTDPEATTLTIGEIILLGALDFDHTCPGTGPGNGRAWIGNVGDVVIGPDPCSSSRKAGVKKSKGQGVAVMNTEMTNATKRNFNVSLPTPPESSSSSNSAESIEEEQEEGVGRVGRTQIYARPIPQALLACSSPSHLGEIRNLHRRDQARTPSGTRCGKRVSFIEGMDDPLVMSPTSTTSTATNPKSSSSSSSTSTSTPTPAPTILNSKQNNSTSQQTLNMSSDPLPSLPSTPVQIPPLVVHRDRARSPRGSGDNYDLGLGHGVPVPPMMVSMKPSSRSASSSGLGSGMIPPHAQGHEAHSAYGETRLPVPLLEEFRKGLERKGFVGALRKMALWKSRRESMDAVVGLKP